MARFLKIEYNNTTDIGNVLYHDGFTGTLYLDVEVEKPEYETDIEVELDGDKRERKTFQKWQKRYKFDVYCTEDLVDCLSFLQIHNNIIVTLQTGQQINVDEWMSDVEWLEMGCLARVTCSFTETYVVSTNCNDNMEQDCDCTQNLLQVEDIISSGDARYTDPAGNGVVENQKFLLYSAEVVAGQRYTGYVIEYNGYDWSLLDTALSDCILDDDSGSYFWQYALDDWIIHPGLITSATQTGATEFTVVAIIKPNSFGTLSWNPPGGAGPWTEVGDYTTEQLAAGISFDVTAGLGLYSFKVEVWIHGCTSGETAQDHETLT